MILFYLFLRPRPFRERSLAHAFTFFFFFAKKNKKTNKLTPSKRRTALQHTLNARPRARLGLRAPRGHGGGPGRNRALAGEILTLFLIRASFFPLLCPRPLSLLPLFSVPFFPTLSLYLSFLSPLSRARLPLQHLRVPLVRRTAPGTARPSRPASAAATPVG